MARIVQPKMCMCMYCNYKYCDMDEIILSNPECICGGPYTYDLKPIDRNGIISFE